MKSDVWSTIDFEFKTTAHSCRGSREHELSETQHVYSMACGMPMIIWCALGGTKLGNKKSEKISYVKINRNTKMESNANCF